MLCFVFAIVIILSGSREREREGLRSPNVITDWDCEVFGSVFGYVGIFRVWWRPLSMKEMDKDGCKEKLQRGQSVMRLDGEKIKEERRCKMKIMNLAHVCNKRECKKLLHFCGLGFESHSRGGPTEDAVSVLEVSSIKNCTGQ